MPKRDPELVPDPELIDDANPEWTDQMFGQARPVAELLGEAFMQNARKLGRPRAETPKEPVTIRFDAAITRHLRASGKGWQSRVNDAVAAAIKAGRL